jgi:hypothetical protein
VNPEQFRFRQNKCRFDFSIILSFFHQPTTIPDGVYFVYTNNRMEWSEDDDDDDVYRNNNNNEYYSNNNNNNTNEYYQDDDDSDISFDFNKVLKNEQQQVDDETESLTYSNDDGKRRSSRENTKKNNTSNIDNSADDITPSEFDNIDNDSTNKTNNNKSVDKNRIHIPRPDRFIPWDRLVASMYNPNNNNIDTILNYISYPEMDQLLGWATDYENTNITKDNDGTIKDPSQYDNPLECLTNTSTRNVPLNPIYLQYIHDTAIELITGQEDKTRRTRMREDKAKENSMTVQKPQQYY